MGRFRTKERGSRKTRENIRIPYVYAPSPLTGKIGKILGYHIYVLPKTYFEELVS